MIRSILALFVFAVVLCAMIIIQPSNPLPAQFVPQAPADVSRTQTPDLLTAALPSEAPSPTQPQAFDRSAMIPVTSIAAPPADLPASTTVPTSDVTLLATTTSILEGLGLDPVVPDTGGEAQSTSALLRQIGAVPAAPEDEAFQRLIVIALEEGRSDADIDAMVNAAAQAGVIRVPEVLATADGRVDTAVLLKSVVVQATIAQGGAAPDVPEVPLGDGSGVEVRVVQRATETEQYRFYTVSRGDSLGAIAMKFYGDATEFTRIFEANRSVLSSPNRIAIGQRLVIPELPTA